MRLKTLYVICTLTLVAGVGSARAVNYRIASISDAGVTIAFSLNEQEKHSPPPDRRFVFAVTCLPQAGCTVQAGPISAVAAATIVEAKIIRGGWAPPYYLVWISFSPYYSVGGAAVAVDEGSITFRCPTAVFDPSRASGARVMNTIAYVPIKQQVRALHSVEAVSTPFNKGVKIETDRDGIYEITAEQLQRLGVPLGAISSKLFKLFRQNSEVPLYLTNAQHTTMQPGDAVLFYGAMLRTAASPPTHI